MSNSNDAVRKILDLVKADKRTSLTAPEGKLVCDAYGIPVPKEGVAKSAADAAKIATDMAFRCDEDCLAGYPSQDRSGWRDGRRQDRRGRRKELCDHPGECQEVQIRRQDRRHPGPADAAGRPGVIVGASPTDRSASS